MDQDEPRLSRRGPAALLALLLSILLSPAGAATALAEVGPASYTQPQPGKSALVGRAIRRSSDDQTDPADPTFDSAGLPPSAAGLVRPQPAPLPAAARPSGLFAEDRPAPFRARAPPAA